jgi:hypothetical protein
MEKFWNTSKNHWYDVHILCSAVQYMTRRNVIFIKNTFVKHIHKQLQFKEIIN